MANRLALETSPYLLQHQHNPVDWFAWGDEAFAEARRLDKPILLSVGYSACHWCHVMERESFEDPAIAALMNELFVCIKVDREERPDVDSIYMQAVQAMTGQGGWPMTVFCTPRGVPYFGGTYFPPEDRMNTRGLPYVLRAAEQAYRERRDAVDATGEQLRAVLTPPRLRDEGEIAVAQLEEACRHLVEQTDRRSGGFGRAPKFPHPAALDLLLRRYHATGDRALWDAVEITLDRMARGGVYDQLGGGFHRYSVDGGWAVPHFEKMLYDNAQLAPVYLHAFQLSGEERWRHVCVETLDWALREMRLPEGGFASAQDADSEGEEGRFFVWTPEQLHDVLDEADANFAARLFGVVPGGNFEHGATVLSLPYPLEQVAEALGLDAAALRERLDGIRHRLLQARDRRVHPARDGKVVTSWNALMLRALAESGAVLERDDYLDAARHCAAFLLEHLVVDGVLHRTWKDGRAKVTGFLEDVAALADALLTLYEAGGEAPFFREAEHLCGEMLARFHDPVSGFYDTAVDAEPLLVRPRTLDDNAVPAGQSMAALAMLRLHVFTGEERWHNAALEVVRPLAPAMARSPLGLANLGWALDLALADPREVAIVGDPADAATHALLRAVRESFDPARVLAWGAADGVPLMQDRGTVDGRPAAYVCRHFTCEAPVTDVEALRAQLSAGGPGLTGASTPV
ncbi:MAG: thioredoxin domain-containing protein [Chloroflexi bacterium]|nr:MAG: thioredoxin domain-containing protein [Chloroflexota bacterium]